MDYDVCMELFEESGIFYAEPLVTGTLEAMTSFHLGFDSKLPAKFGLPPLGKPNVAEGVVIKPLKDAVLECKKGPTRVIFKRKVAAFEEVRKRGLGKENKGTSRSRDRTPANSQDFELLRDDSEVLARITIQRIVNVTSKLGHPSPTLSLTKVIEPISQDNGEPLTKSTVTAREKESGGSTVAGGVQWEDIVRGLVKDVIEELELECEELWSSCQRDGEKIKKLMQEMREQCTQCVEEYTITIEE